MLVYETRFTLTTGVVKSIPPKITCVKKLYTLKPLFCDSPTLLYVNVNHMLIYLSNE